MPIDGTARHSGQCRDVGQGRTRHASLEKRLFGGFEYLAASLLGFLFGTTDHGSKHLNQDASATRQQRVSNA
ncbi:hypothetical protein D3C84_1061820 [compost metagenome]